MLRALPLDFVKYLEIVVDAVCDIIPCPEKRIKNIDINNIVIDVILEKKKHEIDSNIITMNENLDKLISSIFFPSQINKIPLNKVAEA